MQPIAEGVFIDSTFGAGGYSRMLVEGGAQHVYAFDRDPQVHPYVQRFQEEHPGRLTFYCDIFSCMDHRIPDEMREQCQGVVFDLGVSSMQLKTSQRGFSFQHDGPLDMRMSLQGCCAGNVLARESEKVLADIFFLYGEEPRARTFAKAIVRQRHREPWTHTRQLAQLALKIYGPSARRRRVHPATRVFQALRIYVNKELDQLIQGLHAAEAVLAPGGRLVVVSFHSLEDRIVKRFLKTSAPILQSLTSRPQRPQPSEVQQNPRSRSAKMRWAQKQKHST